MALSGERLLVAAMATDVAPDQAFESLPPHMSYGRPFTMGELQRPILLNAMRNIFLDQPVLRNTTGGRTLELVRDGEPVFARFVRGVDRASKDNPINPHWHAIHSLASGIGKYDEEDEHNHEFLPHVTDTEDFGLGWRQRIRFGSVALISMKDEDHANKIIANFPLAKYGRG